MSNKGYTRLLLITMVFIVTGGMLVFASAQAVKTSALQGGVQECTDGALQCCNKGQEGFSFWDILSRTIFTAIQ